MQYVCVHVYIYMCTCMYVKCLAFSSGRVFDMSLKRTSRGTPHNSVTYSVHVWIHEYQQPIDMTTSW